MKVDGSHLRWKCEQLLSVVHAQYKQKQVVVSLELSQIEAVNHKLDLIAGHLAKFNPPSLETNANHTLSIVKEDTA